MEGDGRCASTNARNAAACLCVGHCKENVVVVVVVAVAAALSAPEAAPALLPPPSPLPPVPKSLPLSPCAAAAALAKRHVMGESL